MKYLKQRWEEDRGDEFDFWGNSLFLFELERDKYPIRQIVYYDNGIILKYDKENMDDQYGGLTDQELDITNCEESSQIEFNNYWTKRNSRLTRTIDSETMTIYELDKIEIDLPISDQFYSEIFENNVINKLQHLPMKYGPIQDFEEAMILPQGLKEMIEILNLNKSKFSRTLHKEIDSIVNFAKQTLNENKSLQFWL